MTSSPAPVSKREREKAAREVSYAKHKAAEERVLNRLAAVLDRLDVAMQFESVHSGAVSQTLHAVRFAVGGKDETPPQPSLYLAPEDAYDLVRILATLLNNALHADEQS